MAITVNMTKARTVHLTEIRRVRNKELGKLDIEWFKADDSSKVGVESQRQTLRDIPATFDLSAPSTANALKALWPSELPERS
jgi:hypothetical protein